MKFPVGLLNTDDYNRKISDLLADKDCALIFDTNLFSQLFKLYPTARAEFYVWVDKQIADNRVSIPNWAVHEYVRRFITNNLVSYVGELAQLKTVNTTLQHLSSFLKMYVDDPMLVGTSYSRKSDYFNDLTDVIAKLKKVTAATKPVKDYINDLNDEIRGRFDAVVMQSNIHEVSTKIYQEAAIRRENLIPPGFQDGDKEDNKYGDLVIWKEILDYCNDRKIAKAIFITNDGKKDWVYKPQKITSHGGRESNNQSYQLADPRLVDEFKGATGSEEFYIINFATLVQALWTADKEKFMSLSAAIQINETPSTASPKPYASGEETPDDLSVISEPESTYTVDIIKTPDISESKLYSPDAFADKEFYPSTPLLIEIVSNLRTYTWEVQNRGIALFLPEIINSLEINEDNKNSLFVIGRNIYQAACGNAFSAIEFIQNLPQKLKTYKVEAREHIANGIFYEIYFNNEGLIREDKFKVRLLSQVAVLQGYEIYKSTIDFISQELKPYQSKGIFLPSYPSKLYKIEMKYREIIDPEWKVEFPLFAVESLTHSEISLLRPQTKKENYFDGIVGDIPIRYNKRSLFDKITETFGVPNEQIDVFTEPVVKDPMSIFQLPNGMEIGWLL